MDRQVFAQRDFSAGQIDETSLRRDDTDVQRAGLRMARNVRLLNAGGLKRRPGRRQLFASTGITERIRPAVGQFWYMTFEAGQITFRDQARTNVVTFTGMPWSTAIIEDLRFDVSGGNVIVVHQSMRPRVFSFNSIAQTWASVEFTFALDENGARREPYHQFYVGTGVTVVPSARTGNIRLTASAAVFSPLHVGFRFRYVGRQVEITNFVDPMNADGTVIEELPPTFAVSTDNTAGLEVGDIVEGVNSGCKGQVVAVSRVPASFVIVITANWNGFDLTSGVNGGGEKIAGPRSSMTILSQGQIAANPTVDWEEALLSNYRGWPGSVTSVEQRLSLSNFPQYGPGIVWSAIGTLNDFLVGPNAEDAIFEYIPENCQVLSVSGFQGDEFVLTDTGIFYVPISASNPLKPGSVNFRRISNDAASTIKAQATSDGLAYVNASQTRVLAVQPTGQQAAPYIVQDLTELHASLIKRPLVIAVTPADVIAPERYLYAVNTDGTMAVARHDKSRKWVGWVPWDGLGQVKWVSAAGPEVMVDVEYPLSTGTVRYAEAFDDAMLVDGALVLASATGGAPLTTGTAPLTIGSGEPISLGATYMFNWAAGLTVSVVRDGWYRGDYTVGSDGSLSDTVPIQNAVSLVGGFNFEVEVEPFVPQAQEGASHKQRLRRRRLTQVACVVQGSQAIEVAGRLVPFWNGNENQEEPPPLRSMPYRARVMGRDFDPRWNVRQVLPGALTVLELTTEVTV